MKNRERQKANRKYYRSKEREEARCAGMDNIIGNRRVYRDPTAHEAMRELCRPTGKADPAARVQSTVYTGPDSIPLMTRVLLPDGRVTDYPVSEAKAKNLCARKKTAGGPGSFGKDHRPAEAPKEQVQA